MSGEQEYDQPPGLRESERGLPPAGEAATRVLAYVSWFGDGIVNHEYDHDLPYGEADPHFGPPLYARDLEAVAKAAQLGLTPDPGAGGVRESGRQDAAGPQVRPPVSAPGKGTAATTTALVVVATHGDGEPLVVAGIPESTADPERYLEAWSKGPWSDAHLAAETVSYERLP